ncbi:imidazole glycerol phosphate synthase subunit HisH [Candidatus Aerophobetes bacterium]|nr:imidazole glycerol phosphate synthase subunit HisH [Candidatus Aerophobetes bacterium]
MKRISPTIVVIDYEMGNLLSVQKALQKIGCRVKVTDNPSAIEKATGLVLPGVGSFRDCMTNLSRKGLVDAVYKFIHSGHPFLGICLGMQILFTESEEFGRSSGLDILKGKVVPFCKKSGLKVPHVGWNSIKIRRGAPALKDIPDNSYFYFVHSYYVLPEDKDIIATTTEYGEEFVSSVWKDNVFACQFHPEKSQRLGLALLKNFKETVYAG